jgi:hypothetical protein
MDNAIQQTPMDDNLLAEEVKTLLGKFAENRKLRELADMNGVDIKNSVRLTNDSMDAVAVSIVSLLLCKREDPGAYHEIVLAGLRNRELKVKNTNRFKNQAIQLINRHKNNP